MAKNQKNQKHPNETFKSIGIQMEIESPKEKHEGSHYIINFNDGIFIPTIDLACCVRSKKYDLLHFEI